MKKKKEKKEKEKTRQGQKEWRVLLLTTAFERLILGLLTLIHRERRRLDSFFSATFWKPFFSCFRT